MAKSEVPGGGGQKPNTPKNHFSRRFGPWGVRISKKNSKIAAKTENGGL